MKSFNCRDLLAGLQANTQEIIKAARRLRELNPHALETAPTPGKWSVAQVLEHLNSYGRYYLPAIEQSLIADLSATQLFKPGWLGNYFTNLMKPSAGGVIGKKMKAPKNHRPLPATRIRPALDNFLVQQEQLLQLLEKAKNKDIGRIRTPISISRLIKLKAGDTFRFLIAHEQRHFIQIEKTISLVSQPINKFPATHLAIQP